MGDFALVRVSPGGCNAVRFFVGKFEQSSAGGHSPGTGGCSGVVTILLQLCIIQRL